VLENIADQMHIDRILILDFGSQYSHIIVRRFRELSIYSELKRCDIPLKEIQDFHPKGIVLSGGPFSVYAEGSPHCVKEFWPWVIESHIPLLGICYGLQEITFALGGKVEAAEKAEYGHAELVIPNMTDGKPHPLFQHLKLNPSRVWMSHGDKVTKQADGFQVIATTTSSEFACVAHLEKHIFGLQFHPEVSHSDEGVQILSNFAVDICGVKPSWNMKAFAQTEIERVRQLVGDSYVIGALSGGVDSTVAGALLHKAIGPKFKGFLIDTGLLRKGEGVEVIKRMQECIPGLDIKCIDASERYFEMLKGVTDPEKKRKIIGNLFVEQFEIACNGMGVPLEGSFLLQGTLYPDVIESISFKGPSHTIKTHHNVGGLPERMKLKVLEPLRELFKDEVRALGEELGLDHEAVWRHPFPGPGLGIRILGEVTRERADLLREADFIFLEEIRKSGDYHKIGQAFVVLLPGVRSVGVMGDQRTYEMCACIRAVQTSDFMTADWYKMPYDVLGCTSTRIINEVRGINRVCYDVTSKPPGTIEWE